jgi:hypothetical protein
MGELLDGKVGRPLLCVIISLAKEPALTFPFPLQAPKGRCWLTFPAEAHMIPRA